ncbi:HSP20 family molecular chaperone IbpA [Bradyrhizobium japonicum]|nr:HSP20 family molecular chaperone IbpA [Bradyrhizobium japonicum]
MRTTFDFAPLWRSTIGFDHLADLVDSTVRQASEDHYPPYNIERSGEDHYRISLAVAGFGADDIAVTAEQNALTIEGRSPRKRPASTCTRASPRVRSGACSISPTMFR